MYLEAGEKNACHEADVHASLVVLRERSEQVPDGEVVLLQGKSGPGASPCRLVLVQRAYGHDGMPYGWFVMRGLEDEPLPELRPEEPRELRAGAPDEEREGPPRVLAGVDVGGQAQARHDGCGGDSDDGARTWRAGGLEGLDGLEAGEVAVARAVRRRAPQTLRPGLVALHSPDCRRSAWMGAGR